MQTHVRTFKDLRVWRKAHELVIHIYTVTYLFPSDEKFGLVSQIRRAAFSISANIVEGYKRKSRRDYLRFLNIAESSLEETKYCILLSHELNYLTSNKMFILNNQCDEVGRMLCGLQKGLMQ